MTPIQTRSLTAVELATLEYLLSAPIPHSEQLQQQLAGLQVVGHCYCGCATINLMPDRSRHPRPSAFADRRDPVVVAASSRPGSIAHPAALLLHVDLAGWLRELEIVDDAGINKQEVLPPPETWQAPQPAEAFFRRGSRR